MSCLYCLVCEICSCTRGAKPAADLEQKHSCELQRSESMLSLESLAEAIGPESLHSIKSEEKRQMLYSKFGRFDDPPVFCCGPYESPQHQFSHDSTWKTEHNVSSANMSGATAQMEGMFAASKKPVDAILHLTEVESEHLEGKEHSYPMRNAIEQSVYSTEDKMQYKGNELKVDERMTDATEVVVNNHIQYDKHESTDLTSENSTQDLVASQTEDLIQNEPTYYEQLMMQASEKCMDYINKLDNQPHSEKPKRSESNGYEKHSKSETKESTTEQPKISQDEHGDKQVKKNAKNIPVKNQMNVVKQKMGGSLAKGVDQNQPVTNTNISKETQVMKCRKDPKPKQAEDEISESIKDSIKGATYDQTNIETHEMAVPQQKYSKQINPDQTNISEQSLLNFDQKARVSFECDINSRQNDAVDVLDWQKDEEEVTEDKHEEDTDDESDEDEQIEEDEILHPVDSANDEDSKPLIAESAPEIDMHKETVASDTKHLNNNVTNCTRPRGGIKRNDLNASIGVSIGKLMMIVNNKKKWLERTE